MKSPQLQKKILRMAAADQRARSTALKFKSPGNAAANRRVDAVDALNRAQVKKIIQDHGWPTFDMVGKRAAKAFWLLVQHYDKIPAFQKKCWVLMGKAVKAGQASAKDYAYLTDRVLLNEGKKQLFATQFTSARGSVFQPQPIANVSGVDERRASHGLEPLWKYARDMYKDYSVYLAGKTLKLPKGYRRGRGSKK
jgi:hypothetical protein